MLDRADCGVCVCDLVITSSRGMRVQPTHRITPFLPQVRLVRLVFSVLVHILAKARHIWSAWLLHGWIGQYPCFLPLLSFFFSAPVSAGWHHSFRAVLYFIPFSCNTDVVAISSLTLFHRSSESISVYLYLLQ